MQGQTATSQHKTSFNSRLRQRGQGMTEYIIIVGVIAIAAIGVFGYFGDTVQHQIAGMAAELSGGDGTAEKGLAETAAEGASTAAAEHKDLSNYTENAQGDGG